MKRYRQVAGFILAGGASSRMGVDKGLLDFGGVPLILRTAQLIEPLVTEVTVVGSPHRYSSLGLRVIPDNFHETRGRGVTAKLNCGPLAGISTALAETSSPWNLILACDLPYLSAGWIDWMLTRATRSHGDAVVPQTERGLEPLAAIYRRECAPTIADALASGMRKVTDIIQKLRLDVVHPGKWTSIDPGRLVLKNMNAPGDYEEALKWKAAVNMSSEHSKKKQPVTKRRQAPKRKPRSAPLRSK